MEQLIGLMLCIISVIICTIIDHLDTPDKYMAVWLIGTITGMLLMLIEYN